MYEYDFSSRKTFYIRPETPGDYDKIDALVGAAFATAHYSDGTEVAWLHAVRRSPHYLPELSFLMFEDHSPVGHILCSRCEYSTKDSTRYGVVIAPLSIAPEAQGRRLGGKLLHYTLDAAAKLGYEVAFLEGYYAYYSRVGFLRAETFGLTAYDPTPGGNELLIRSTTEGPLTGILPGIINIYNE